MFVETKREGEAQTKKKPSLTGFIAWLATMPSNQAYDFTEFRYCALGQYYRSLGLYPEIHALEVFSNDYDQARVLNVPTFGLALERARAFAAEQS